MKKKILVACNDPGGTMACVPVIKRLLEDRKIDTVIYAGKYAQDIFSRESVPFKTLAYNCINREKLKHIENILEKEKPIIVFTSTSFGKVVDNVFSYVAIRKGIKTFVLIDQWCNYSKRFRIYDNNKNFENLPDYIGVIDNIAKQEMIEERFPPERLVVVGHPYFDSLINQKRELSKQQKKSFRDSYVIGNKNIIVTFASAPFKRGEYQKIGYTDIIIIKKLVKALSSIAHKYNRHITLIIKTHPRDERKDSAFPVNSDELIKVMLVRADNATDFILNSDIVTGMDSIFLVESFLLGKPTLSVQIGLKTEDALITNRMGLTKAILSYDELNVVLKDIIVEKSWHKYVGKNSQFLKMNYKSTERTMSLIEKIINS